MSLRARQLDFVQHAAQSAQLVPGGDLQRNPYFLHRAQEMHALEVSDALRDAQTECLLFGQKLKDSNASHYAIFGVGRRLGMMWAAYREIIQTAPPDRTEPLGTDEAASLSRDLNVVYLNIIGLLDNYAWLLLHEVCNISTKSLHRTKVGLFAHVFRADPALVGIEPTLAVHEGWHTSLKEKRDPAAHRIPLAIPPAILSDAEAKAHEQFEAQIGEAFRAQDYAQVDALRETQGRLGKFAGVITHHPNDPYTPLYPTLAQDIANAIKIATKIHAVYG